MGIREKAKLRYLQKKATSRDKLIDELTRALNKNQITVRGTEGEALSDIRICYNQVSKAQSTPFHRIETSIPKESEDKYEQKSRQIVNELVKCQNDLNELSLQNVDMLSILQRNNESVAASVARRRQCESERLALTNEKSAYIEQLLSKTYDIFQKSVSLQAVQLPQENKNLEETSTEESLDEPFDETKNIYNELVEKNMRLLKVLENEPDDTAETDEDTDEDEDESAHKANEDD